MSTVWVNKTATNYNVRTESVAFIVRAYIRGPYARRKRQENLTRLRSETYNHQKIKKRPKAMRTAKVGSSKSNNLEDDTDEPSSRSQDFESGLHDG